MSNKILSIILPVYNSEKYLAESIESIINQTFSDFELIIINDASTDGSREIALKYASKDKRILVIENKYEKGLYGALNSGLELCNADYIARVDGDDINELNRLEIQINFLKENPDISIVGSGYQLFGNGSNRKIFHPSSSVKLAWKFLTNTYFCHPSVMFRSSILQTINQYPKVTCEDFAFFSKIIQEHKGRNIKKILVHYRQHGTNYSNTQSEKIKGSVKNTFIENFKFYTGSFEYSELFYNFHANYNLKLKDVFKVTKISSVIAKKILSQYDMPRFNFKTLFLYITITIHIKKAVAVYYVRRIKNLFV